MLFDGRWDVYPTPKGLGGTSTGVVGILFRFGAATTKFGGERPEALKSRLIGCQMG